MAYARMVRIAGLPAVPVIVLRSLPRRYAGMSAGFFVLLRRDVAGVWPTLVHELEHCRQFWHGGLVVHGLRYWLSRTYRLECELAAYAVELQACAPPQRAARLDDAARALATGYRLGLDTAACRRLLKERAMRAA